MDATGQALIFPPAELDMSSNEKYHTAIKQHIDKLAKTFKSSQNVNFSLVLKAVDPSTNSITFLYVLHYLLDPANGASVLFPELQEHVTRFLVSFDPRQVRYGGPALHTICHQLLQLTGLPSSVAIHAVSIALQRLDPTGTVMTQLHLDLVELAYQTADYTNPELFAVIDKQVLFYPGMHNQVPKGTMPCDMSLPPPHYMSTSIVPLLKPADVLRYNLLRGLIYLARREWSKAYDALEQVATHPTRDGGVSKYMVEAFKKLVLTSLLLKGRAPEMPSYTSGQVLKVYSIVAKPYASFASLFESTNAQGLKTEANTSSIFWEEDCNLGLVAECLTAYQKWQIMGLRDVYTKITLEEVRTQTRSAQTGESLGSVADVEALVREMISSGMLKGTLGTTADGILYLEFLPESEMSEAEFAREVATAARKVKAIEPLWRLVNERLATSKEHVRYLAKMEKREGKKAVSSLQSYASGDGFEESLVDEDIMQDDIY